VAIAGRDDVTVIAASPEAVTLDVGGLRRQFTVARYGSEVAVDSALGSVSLHLEEPFAEPEALAAEGSLLAVMPGSVVRVAVRVGDIVEAGQPILWVEAMKMQHQISAAVRGTVTSLPVAEGKQIVVGDVLAVVSATEPGA
jgi:propionyl-CoA carboxylase alpha chain